MLTCARCTVNSLSKDAMLLGMGAEKRIQSDKYAAELAYLDH